MPSATCTGLRTIAEWHLAGGSACSAAVEFIHRRIPTDRANLLESWCAASHTRTTGFSTCRLMRQRFRPLLSAERHDADRLVCVGKEHVAAGSRIVTAALRNVVRYPHRPRRGSPENGHRLPRQSNRRTATGQPPSHAPMTPCRKNIHATPPQFTTVAPILHGSMTVATSSRAPNLNNGAADADGR